jgi:hypothetical protein
MSPATDTENSAAEATGNRGAPSTELRGPWLFAARTAWMFVVLLGAASFVLSIPAYSQALHSACLADPCAGGQLSPGNMRALNDIGLSIDLYAAYVVALDLVVALGFCVVGALIFWRRSRERGALFISFALVMFGLTWPGIFDAAQTHPVWGRLAGFLIDLGLASLLLLLLVFPDGRFVPRWTRWVAALALVQLSADIFFPDSLFVDPPQALNVSAFLCLWAICLFAQVYRYRRVSGPIQRQQTKWLVFGVTALVVLLAGFLLPYAFFPPLDRPGVLSLTYDLVGRAVVGSLAFLLIPMSIGVAILRYRLYDIDVVINRTLVYSLLTVALILVYVGSVVSLQRIFVALTGNDSQLSIVASTLAIAALFGPLRRRIQAFIDRRFYRKKYDARKTLEAFNARLRNETNLDALVRDLAAAVGETMQPEHVSVWLRPSPGTSPRPEERTR